MNFFERRSCLLYNYGLYGFTLGLWLLREGWRACIFYIIGAIWGTSWLLRYCSLFLISLDLALQVSLEFLDSFLYFINTALAWVLLLRLGINLSRYFNFLCWFNNILLVLPSCIFILFAQRGFFRLRWTLIIMLLLRYKSSIPNCDFSMLIIFFDRRFTAWIGAYVTLILVMLPVVITIQH